MTAAEIIDAKQRGVSTDRIIDAIQTDADVSTLSEDSADHVKYMQEEIQKATTELTRAFNTQDIAKIKEACDLVIDQCMLTRDSIEG